MQSDDKTILITGATGRQGGAALRHLQQSGWKVRALVRDPQKPQAQQLAQSGIELVRGDLNQRDSLDRALQNVYGVFSVQTFTEEGPEGEVHQGINLADAAKRANVRHMVYSSVGGAERNSGVPHFESKWQIEQHARSLQMPLTVLRPTFFMENFLRNREQIRNGTLSLGLKPETRLMMIATDDIGGFVALAFNNPNQYIGRELELAGDDLTMTQVAATMSKVIGRPVQYVQQPLDQIRAFSTDLAQMYQWFMDEGYKTDIAELRKLYPPLMTLEDWLRKTGWGQ